MKLETLCLACMDTDEVDVDCPKCGRPAAWKPDSAMHLAPGILLRDQYVIGRALGHGGFGITYLGWDTDLARKTAIKEYMPNGVAGRASGAATVTPFSAQTQSEFEWGLEKFMEEARVLARFHNHIGIVSVITFFRANGTAYLVMEYLDGTTFEDFLKRRAGKIAWETALRIINPILDALSAVHAEGILHRDISPDNIYLTRTGQVKLIDFGAARNALGQKSRNLSIILKEGYAPEEQYRTSGMQGPWTDVYAVGATLYHALTGRIPPPALDRQASVAEGKDSLIPPADLGAVLSPEAEAAVLKALAIKASDRFQSVQDFQYALAGNIDPAPTRAINRDDPRLAELTGLMPAQRPASGTPPPPPVVIPPSGQPSYQPPYQPAPYQPAQQGPPSYQPPYATGTYQQGPPTYGPQSGPISGGGYPPRPPSAQPPFQMPPATSLPPPVQLITTQKSASWVWIAALAVIGIGGFAYYKSQDNGGGGSDKPPIGANEQPQQQQKKQGDNSNQQQKQAPPSNQTPPSNDPKQQRPPDNNQQQQQQRKPVDDKNQQQQRPPQQQKQGPSSNQAPPSNENPKQQRPPDNNPQQQQQPPYRPPDNQQPQQQPRAPGADYMGLTTQAQQAMVRNDAQNSVQLLQQAIAMSPNTPRAYDMLGYVYLYMVGDVGSAEQNYRSSIRNGGGATFRVAHDHSGTFGNLCNAVLQVSAAKATITSQTHAFTIARNDIREVKGNRMPAIVPGVRNNPVVVNAKSFHIKGGGKTFNLAPTSRVKDQERDLIIRLIERP